MLFYPSKQLHTILHSRAVSLLQENLRLCSAYYEFTKPKSKPLSTLLILSPIETFDKVSKWLLVSKIQIFWVSRPNLYTDFISSEGNIITVRQLLMMSRPPPHSSNSLLELTHIKFLLEKNTGSFKKGGGVVSITKYFFLNFKYLKQW